MDFSAASSPRHERALPRDSSDRFVNPCHSASGRTMSRCHAGQRSRRRRFVIPGDSNSNASHGVGIGVPQPDCQRVDLSGLGAELDDIQEQRQAIHVIARRK